METLKRPTRIKPSFAFEDLRFENICFQTKKTLRNQEVKLLFCSLSEKHEKDRETCEKYQFTDFYCVLLKKKSFGSSLNCVLKTGDYPEEANLPVMMQVWTFPVKIPISSVK